MQSEPVDDECKSQEEAVRCDEEFRFNLGPLDNGQQISKAWTRSQLNSIFSSFESAFRAHSFSVKVDWWHSLGTVATGGKISLEGPK
jgi:hypothetical protein